MSDARDYNFSLMTYKPRLFCFKLAYKELFLTYLLPMCHCSLGMLCTQLTHMLGHPGSCNFEQNNVRLSFTCL
jgi:hypothetical protein